MKLDEYHDYLKPFVEYLNFMPDRIEYNETIIYANKIMSDPIIIEKLGDI
jgi:hypothetical protein